jgi:flagellar hook-length control protein FliK
MTPLATLLTFTGPVASADATTGTGLPTTTPETTGESEDADFSSLLASALAGLSQAQPQPQPVPTEAPATAATPVAAAAIAAQPAPPATTAIESQPVREGARFTESAPPVAQPPAGTPAAAPQDPTTPTDTDQLVEAEEAAAQQAVAVELPELPVEVAPPALPELIEADIQTALLAQPEELFLPPPDRLVTPTPRETVEPRVAPATSNVVPPPVVAPTTRPTTPVPTAQPVAAPIEAVEPTPTVVPTPQPAITPAATIAAGRTPAVPSLVPAQPAVVGPVPADPTAAVAVPTGIDRPAEPVEAAPAVAAVPTLTETPTREVRDRFTDVVGEIGERPLAKRPTFDAGQTPIVPFETRLAAAQPTETPQPVETVRPAPAVQVADAIVTRAEIIGKGEYAEFRLRLDPPELGQIEVRVHRTSTGVHADLRVADEAVRQMIESQLPELRQRLEAAGLPVDRFNLTTQDGSTNRDRQQRFEPEQTEDRPAPRRPAAAVGPKTYTAPAAGGRLDITA